MKNFATIFLLSTFFVLSGTSRLFAQVPVNDNCATATLLTPALACNPTAGTTQNATNSNTPGNCPGSQQDVWYRFVATAIEHQVRVDGAPLFDAVIGALISCGGTTRPAGGDCADYTNSDGVEVLNLSGLTIGATYYIQVYDYYGSTAATADFDICVKRAALLNDDCANAAVLTPNATCVPIAGTTEQATSSNAVGDCGANQPDVWYSFVAVNSMYQVRVDGAPLFDAVIGALISCGGTARPAGGDCVDNTNDDGVEILNLSGLTIGATYYIQVYDYYGRVLSTSDFDICLLIMPPPNDACANATPLTPATTCVPTAGTTESAGVSGGAGDCSGGTRPDVWYKFVATNTTHQVRVDGGPFFDGVIGALTACGGTTRPTGGGCVDQTGDDGVETLNLSGLTVGNTYYIQVYDFYGANASTADFDICVLRPPPANDQCINAASFTPALTCVPTAGTTESASISGGAGDCSGGTRPDVWYKFVATNTTHQVRVDGGPFFDGVIGALTACGGTTRPTGGGCVDNSGDDGVEILNLSGLTVGNTYYIQVYDFYGAIGSTADFDICVLRPPPLPLELAAFTGQVQDHINVLYWETLTEKNVAYHFVERSTDGLNWQEIGRKNGLANSSVPVKYHLEDRIPLAKAYYRLTSVDFDRQQSRSNTILLTRKSEQSGITSVFPSPTKNNVTVQFNSIREEQVIIQVLDMTGRLVLEQRNEVAQGSNDLLLTLDSLQAGIYMVKVSTGGETFAPVRLVKE